MPSDDLTPTEADGVLWAVLGRLRINGFADAILADLTPEVRAEALAMEDRAACRWRARTLDTDPDR